MVVPSGQSVRVVTAYVTVTSKGSVLHWKITRVVALVAVCTDTVYTVRVMWTVIVVVTGPSLGAVGGAGVMGEAGSAGGAGGPGGAGMTTGGGGTAGGAASGGETVGGSDTAGAGDVDSAGDTEVVAQGGLVT